MPLGHTKRRKLAFLFTCLMLSFTLIQPIFVQSFTTISNPSKAGPFIDVFELKVITQDDQLMLALQDDEIDIIGQFIPPSTLPPWYDPQDLYIENTQHNGYTYVTINCAKYPLNITAFRRALAFALDKEAICDDAWDGLAVALDSVVPHANPLCIDGTLPYNYYESNPTMGNYLLDQAGFADLDDDDYREAPDGSDFDVHVWTVSSSNMMIDTGEIIAEALRALGIDAMTYPVDFTCSWELYFNEVYLHGNYDMMVFSTQFDNFNVDWLGYEFWSGYADIPYHNLPSFQNDSYDSWRDQLLYSVEYEDIYEAAIEMQKILVYECPIVVCSDRILLSGYSEGGFVPFEHDVLDGFHGWWTAYRSRLRESNGGPFGGTLRIGIPLDIESFNPMLCSSKTSQTIHELLWDSLFRRGPDGNDIPWVVESYVAEINSDNAQVPEGHVRFTFEIIRNATWSDGSPLTAEDIAFTLNYYRDAHGNPYQPDLVDMTAAYAPSTYRLVLEFNSESYWHLHKIAYKPILPKSDFIDIGPEKWDEWSLIPNESDITMFRTSGPFRIADYVRGESITLLKNPQYFYRPENSQPEEPTTTTTDDAYPLLIALEWAISSMCTVVIIGLLVIWRRDV